VANRALPDLAESNAEAEAEERDADNNIDIDIDNDIDAPPLPVHRNWSYDSLGFGSSGRTVGGAGSRSSMRGSKSSLRTPKSASGSNASHVPASTRFEWRHVGELIMRQKTFEGVQNPSGGKNSKMEGAAFSASRRFNIQRTGSLHAQQQAKEAKEKEAKDQNKSVQVYQLVRQVDGDGPSGARPLLPPFMEALLPFMEATVPYMAVVLTFGEAVLPFMRVDLHVSRGDADVFAGRG